MDSDRGLCIAEADWAGKALEGEPFEADGVVVSDDALAEAMRSRRGQDDGVSEAVRRDAASLEELTNDYYVERRISRDEFFAARSGLEKRLEANRMRLARRDRRGVLAGFVGDGGNLRRAWEGGSLDWRRAVVGALLDRVVIAPGEAGFRLTRSECGQSGGSEQR